MIRTTIRVGTLILCTTIAGCSLLAPVRDTSRFFTLTSVVDKEHQATCNVPAGSNGVEFGLGPVGLPAYLDRNEVATRLSPTEVTYSPNDRWAEPLSEMLGSVLLQNLSASLACNRVVPYPSISAASVDYQVEVTILQFDIDTAGTARLVARWRVNDLRKGTNVTAKETDVSHSGQPADGRAVALALSSVVSNLSEEIAGSLRSLPATSPPPPTPSRASASPRASRR